MKKNHSGTALAWLVATLVLTSCGGGGSGTSNNVSSTALPGKLDASFGSGGITRTGMILGPRAMTILPNGKIEVPGKALFGSSVEYILKLYKADGSIDNSFGNGGKLTLQPSGQVFDVTGLVHQQDGKVVIVGSSFNGTDYDIHVVRFLADGTPDSVWGDRGQIISTTGTNERAGGVMVQPDGKIVVVGSAENGSNRDFLVVRFTPDGSLDATFGMNGIVKTSFSGFGNTSSKAEFVAHQPDGKIIVYGYVIFAYQYNSQHEMALVRYNSDGSIDTGFGINGRLEIPSDPVPMGLLLRNDGKIYIGSSDSVWRVNASGVIEAGMYAPGMGGFSVDSKNRVIVASQEADSAGNHIAITRLLPNGNSDLSFGTNGKITEKLSEYDYPRTVLVQNDDRILVEASTRESGTDLLIVLRYTP